MKYGICLLAIVGFLYGCSNRQLAQPKDYNVFLQPAHLNKAVEKNEQEIAFWQMRLQQDPQSFVNLSELGYYYLGLFKLKGDVQHLKKGDSLLKLAASHLNNTDPNLLQALSQVAITQHQFQAAANYNQQAFEQEGSPYIHALLSFDVGMELGQYQLAKGKLNDLKDQQSFDYLIRKAKYLDHNGDLEGAIELMEKAFAKVAQTNKIALYCWALSYLGDMYGHAGRIEESYAAYLNVLQHDPSYLYALRGIAWIAYAHDKNAAEAKRILKFVVANTNDPQVYLTLAEIAAFEKDKALKGAYIDLFLKAVSHSGYKAMYNKALIEIYTTEKVNLAKAQQLAEDEVSKRPTPETYSWLAWVHFNKGEKEKAYQLFITHVKGRAFEPEVLRKGAYIMEAAGEAEQAKTYLKECLSSGFELGPVTERELAAKLK